MINNQMGELSRLLPDFELSSADKIQVLQMANIGIPEINIPDLIRKMANRMGLKDNIEDLIPLITLNISTGISGLLGNSDEIENSGEDTIKNANYDIYLIARELSNYNQRNMRIIATNIRYGPYQLNNFVMCLNLAYRDLNAAKIMLDNINQPPL